MSQSSKVNDARGTRIAVGLVPALYDRVDVAYPSATVTVYTFLYLNNQVGEVTITTTPGGDLVSAERTA